MLKDPKHIRNVAIVAHIDHGKTTLIDSIFRTAKTFRENANVAERIMDSNDLERERGITIKSKHCSVDWHGYRINIVDTPGHADFSGEVERVLSLVDSVILLVDAAEGPMPQTRYVLSRALKMGLKPIVVVNKVDRGHADPDGTLDKTFDLFVELGATDGQCDFPILYGSGLSGWLVRDLDTQDASDGLTALFETIIEHVPAPKADMEAPFLMQVSTLAYSDYLGQIGCGKILQGVLKTQNLLQTKVEWRNISKTEYDITSSQNTKCAHLFITEGLDREEVEEAGAGDIVWLSGPEQISIGDIFSSTDIKPSLPPLDIEEPTVALFFLVNSGPFAGNDGQAITLRQLKARLERETMTDVALRVDDLGRPDGLKVSGRGELQLAILMEEMRREGMEFCVSRPEVITQTDADGRINEPFEELTIEVPEMYQGVIIQKLAMRKGELLSMENMQTGTLKLTYKIPTRGLIGYRGEFLTDTRGLGILTSLLLGYAPWFGEIKSRSNGSMVSVDFGESTSYALENLQTRGVMFVSPGDPVYNGMVVGENARPSDMPCNPAKRKQMTNHRSATKDATIILDVPRKLNIDLALEWIGDDELVEITPKNIRIRKMILDAVERKRAARQ